MRRIGLVAAFAVVTGAVACVPDDVLPDDPAWRDAVVEAINHTEGVDVTEEITVADIDPGFGNASPKIRGSLRIDADDPQPIVDDLVRNVCDVLGTETFGIGWGVFMRVNGEQASLIDHGYEKNLDISGVCSELG